MLVKDCVFCKMLRGEIPYTKVYEDELVLAILDIAPFNYGHIIVFPKDHHNVVTTLPEEYSARMISVCAKLGAAVIHGLGAGGFNIMVNTGSVAGQTVQHCHFHVIPRFVDDEVTITAAPKQYESFDKMAETANRIIEKLQPQA